MKKYLLGLAFFVLYFAIFFFAARSLVYLGLRSPIVLGGMSPIFGVVFSLGTTFECWRRLNAKAPLRAAFSKRFALSYLADFIWGVAFVLIPFFLLFFPILGFLFASDCLTPIASAGGWFVISLAHVALFLAIFECRRTAPIARLSVVNNANAANDVPKLLSKRVGRKTRLKIVLTALATIIIPTLGPLFNNSPFHAEGWLAPPAWRDVFCAYRQDAHFAIIAIFFAAAIVITAKAGARELNLEADEKIDEKR